ncbi:MAG TPA: aspartyl protease family protein [Phycisphaerae bacterium]|nr:aspartyl protease family protein [Phycisphaerae bacterium]
MDLLRCSCLRPAAGLVAVLFLGPYGWAQDSFDLSSAPQATVIRNGSVEVPMHRYRHLPIMEARVNGKGPFRFVVDTGSPVLIVNRHIADDLALPTPERFRDGPEIMVAGPGGQGLPASFHEVESLQVGEAEFRKVVALGLDSPLSREFDGVIGMGVFRDCVLTYDYAAGRFRITEAPLPAANGGDVLDFTYETPYSAPVVPVSVNGTPHRFIIDTGASGWFSFSDAVTDGCSYAYGPVAGPKARSLDREIDTKVGRLSGRLEVGEYVFKEPYGTVGEGMERSLIGNEALENFAFSVDQKNRRVRLARAGKADIVLPPFRTPGFGLMKGEAGLTVMHVMDDSPAERAGLAVGDKVVSIERQPAEDVYGLPMWDKLLEHDSIHIGFIPGGATEPRELDIDVMILVP